MKRKSYMVYVLINVYINNIVNVFSYKFKVCVVVYDINILITCKTTNNDKNIVDTELNKIHK